MELPDAAGDEAADVDFHVHGLPVRRLELAEVHDLLDESTESLEVAANLGDRLLGLLPGRMARQIVQQFSRPVQGSAQLPRDTVEEAQLLATHRLGQLAESLPVLVEDGLPRGALLELRAHVVELSLELRGAVMHLVAADGVMDQCGAARLRRNRIGHGRQRFVIHLDQLCRILG